MPQHISHGNIKEDILQLLDKVVSTGVPVQIERKGKRLVISPVEKRRELDQLEEHPDFLVGDPEELVHIDWTSEWRPEL